MSMLYRKAGKRVTLWTKSVKLVIGLALLLTSGTAAIGGGSLFVADRPLAMPMTTATFAPSWDWHNGVPDGDWKNQVPSSAATVKLDGSTDLDKLNGKASPANSEGVLYNRITAAGAGVVQLGFGCDWWMEVYCNGTLCSSTFPEGNLNDRYAADNHPVLIPVKAGENLLAVRVKRGSLSWQFAYGVLPFHEPDRPQVRLGPWLGDSDSYDGSIAIRFITAGKVGSGVEFRRVGQKEWTMAWDQEHGRIMRREWHTVRLTGLESGADYEYRLVMIDPQHPKQRVRIENAAAFAFKIPAETAGKCSFFFTADMQFPRDRQHQTIRSLLNSAVAEKCDFLVFGGDTGSDFPNFEKCMVEPVIDYTAKLLPGKPILVMRGNHELRGDDAQNFGTYFGTADGAAYRLFRAGDTAFLVLDCWEDTPQSADWCQYNLDAVAFAEQAQWLKQVLTSEKWQKAKRHIVLCHGAPYSQYDSGQTMPFMLERLTDPYFAGKKPVYRLDFWMSGHSHSYARSIPGTDTLAAPFAPRQPDRDGKNYVYPVLTVAGPGPHPQLEASAFRVDITPAAITISAFAPDGKCFDQVEYRSDNTYRELKELPHFNLPGRN